MIRYTATKQLSIEDFQHPFGKSLNPNNKWVLLSNAIDWDLFATYYYEKMSRKRGAPSKDARLVLGSLIIKHMCNLSDQATIEMIQENIYMQYFVGLSSFSWDPIFDASLFVSIRKRLSKSLLDNIVVSMIKGETDFVKKKVTMLEL